MCHPDCTPAGISVRTCTMSRPGTEELRRSVSVRLRVAASSSACSTASGDMAEPFGSSGNGEGREPALEERGQGVRGLLGLILDDEVAGRHRAGGGAVG